MKKNEFDSFVSDAKRSQGVVDRIVKGLEISFEKDRFVKEAKEYMKGEDESLFKELDSLVKDVGQLSDRQDYVFKMFLSIFDNMHAKTISVTSNEWVIGKFGFGRKSYAKSKRLDKWNFNDLMRDKDEILEGLRKKGIKKHWAKMFEDFVGSVVQWNVLKETVRNQTMDFSFPTGLLFFDDDRLRVVDKVICEMGDGEIGFSYRGSRFNNDIDFLPNEDGEVSPQRAFIYLKVRSHFGDMVRLLHEKFDKEVEDWRSFKKELNGKFEVFLTMKGL